MQQHERATFTQLRRETGGDWYGSPLTEERHGHATVKGDVENATKLYFQPGPSNMSPLQRFVLTSSTIDPLAMHGRSTTAGDQRVEGMFRFLEPRTEAAVSVAARARPDRTSSLPTLATRGST